MIVHLKAMPELGSFDVLRTEPCDPDFNGDDPHDAYVVIDPNGVEDTLCSRDAVVEGY